MLGAGVGVLPLHTHHPRVVVTQVMVLNSALDPGLMDTGDHTGGGGGHDWGGGGGQLGLGADPVVDGGEGLVLEPNVCLLGRSRGRGWTLIKMNRHLLQPFYNLNNSGHTWMGTPFSLDL